MNWLNGKKTYLVAGLMATMTLLQLITGETTLQQFILSDGVTTLLQAVGLGTLRAGVAKKTR